jgi:hypothetical protein
VTRAGGIAKDVHGGHLEMIGPFGQLFVVRSRQVACADGVRLVPFDQNVITRVNSGRGTNRVVPFSVAAAIFIQNRQRFLGRVLAEGHDLCHAGMSAITIPTGWRGIGVLQLQI